MTIDELLELARQTMEYSATASPRPWTPSREPRPASNRYFDRHTTDGSTPIESRGTQFALGVAVGVTSDPVDADAIAFWRNNADKLARAVQVLANAMYDIDVETNSTAWEEKAALVEPTSPIPGSLRMGWTARRTARAIRALGSIKR